MTHRFTHLPAIDGLKRGEALLSYTSVRDVRMGRVLAYLLSQRCFLNFLLKAFGF